MSDKPDLASAYDLDGPDGARELYDAWADTYDNGFAAGRGYLLPGHVARVFSQSATPDDSPVADIGAGTGLVGAALPAHRGWTLDGLDISAGMLARAREKGLYRDLIEMDFTRPETLPLARYGGLVSAGTFTHGHLGPDTLRSVLGLGRPGALAVLAVNSKHFSAMGFETLIRDLENQARIESLVQHIVPIYAPATDSTAGDAHDSDDARILVFRTL